jgi:hypothetical protein
MVMKRLLLFLVVPTYLWAIEYDAERYYQLSEYVTYELQQCPALVVDSPLSADMYAQASSYDQSSIFVHQQPRQGALSNSTIGGGIFVVGFAVIQCMDWWIKRNRRIEQFVTTYDAWTRDDYQRLFEGACHGEAEWHLPDEKLFPLYHHYQFHGFRQYLKTRAGYEQEILNLAAALKRKDKTVRKAIKHMPGCSVKTFTALIHDMATDIERARVLRVEGERQASEARQAPIKYVMQEDHGELAEIASVWCHADVPYYSQRLQAYEQIQSGNVYWSEQPYQINNQVSVLIGSGHYQPDDYKTLYGNQLQHVLHIEQVTILSHAAAITTEHHIPLLDRMSHALVECVDVSHYYTQQGYLAHASALTDYAWAAVNLMSEIGTGVAEGLLEGVGDGVMLVAHSFTGMANTLLHPIDKATRIGNKLAGLCKGGWKVCELAYASWHNPDTQWSWEMVGDEMSAIAHCAYQQARELGPRGIAKASMKFVTSELTRAVVEPYAWRAVGKLAKYAGIGTSRIVAGALDKIPVRVAASMVNNTAHIAQAAQKVHVRITTAAHALGSNAATFLSTHLFDLEKEVERLRIAYQYTAKGFGTFADKYIKIDLMHILGLDLSINKKGKWLLGGFHHDFGNAIQKSGALQFLNVKQYAHGFYEAEIWANGQRFRKKGFFPAFWEQNKVANKLYEAYGNAVKKGIPQVKPGEIYSIEGIIEEGITILMHITENGKITSAYPVFDR